MTVDAPALPGVWWWVAAALVAVVGAARLTRLVVHDDYPPSMWLRTRWLRITSLRGVDGQRTGVEGPWSKLLTCHWCFGPWAFALVLLTAWATNLHVAWWVFWGWLAGSYLVSMTVERDEKD